ncbi:MULTISPECIES: hypothetical protein [Vibrio harveyi group]|uniref:hypothetical protein n=1 Tax=Vibrio harveyi group TaxID=717610 RepID=UPI0015582B16|nr:MULTISPECIES: hypothetical protein [Vibrio harveyi group]
MESVILTAEHIDFIAEAFVIYGFIGVLGALFFYDLLCFLVTIFIRRFRPSNTTP